MTESNVCDYQCHLQETELSKIHSDVSNIRVKERTSMNNTVCCCQACLKQEQTFGPLYSRNQRSACL